MNILILGASGMLGKALSLALHDAGHEVTGASRSRPDAVPGAWMPIDFATLIDPTDWLPLIEAFDVVVNCVGIIAERYAGEFDLVHRVAPSALFAACDKYGIAVVQFSALGSDSRSPSAYWRSKGQAEELLATQAIPYAILRPSLVFSPDGASSKLFMALASLPIVLLPGGTRVPVQPVHVEDVTAAVVGLLKEDKLGDPWRRPIAIVGPRRLSLAAYLSALRQAMGAPLACSITLPLSAAAAMARMLAPWRLPLLNPGSIGMLSASTDGRLCADTGAMHRLLGRVARDPLDFARPSMRPAAVMAWAYPMLTLVIALMWLVTAWVSWFAWPHGESHAWLEACGIPRALQESVLASASVADALIGVSLLGPRRWHGYLWPLQIALVLGYTIAMTFCLPEFWRHPFGPLLKNLPLLVVFCAMWRLR